MLYHEIWRSSRIWISITFKKTTLLSLEIPAVHRACCGRWPEWWNPTRQMHAVRFGKLRSDAEAVMFPWYEVLTVDGRHLPNQLRLIVYPIIYRVLYIPGGAGFLPSTVSSKIGSHWQHAFDGKWIGKKNLKWFGQLECGKFKGLGSRIAWHKVYVEIIKQGDLLHKPQMS